jgi:hypothetical protein
MSDVFAVEDDISKAIVGALAPKLVKAESGNQIVEKTTDDPVAYDLYLKGRYDFAQRGVHLRDAEKYFQAAVARDSGFALAWAGLADVYVVMTSWAMISTRDAEAKAIPYARRAVSLAPGVPEPHVSLGFALCTLSREKEHGVEELKRAIALNHSLGLAHYFYSLCIDSQVAGIAMAEALEARRLEPLNAQFGVAVVRAYLLAHEEKPAKELALSLEKSAPNLGSVPAQLFWIYANEEDTLNVRAMAEKLYRLNPGHTDGVKGFFAVIHHDAATLRRNQSFYAKHPEAVGIYLAGAYALLRNADSSITWLDRTYAANGDLLSVIQYPLFDRIRYDPKYDALKIKYDIP